MGKEIRSTLEIALEKAEKIGKASKEELELEKIKEQAKKLAAKFMENQKVNLKEELISLTIDKSDIFKKAAFKSALEVFLKNIVLPRGESQLQNAKIALQGIKSLFQNVPEVEKLCAEVERLLKEYYQNLFTIYEELKKRLAAGVEDLEKVLSEQMGAQVKVSIENHPQFKEEWQKIKERLDQEYGRPLEYFKNLFEKLIP